MGILRDTIEYYKKLKEEERQKKLLINNNADFGLLEQLVAKINSNPNLRIDINLRDGTVLHLQTYKKEDRLPSSYINGIDYMEIS